MRIPYAGLTISTVLVLITIMTIPSVAQKSSHQEFTARVDSLLAAETESDAPGVAVAVIRHGKAIYRQCFGLASLEHGVPITNETAFNLASVSKQFTAMAMLLLEQEGRLSLDNDIHEYFPELPDYGTHVTVRHLLHHTSGLWEYSKMFRYYGGHVKKAGYTSIEDVLSLLKGQDQLLFDPGSQWVYCNSNYALLGELVARVTGESLASWTKTNIFEPLQMKNTFFRDDCNTVIPHGAGCYYKSEGIYKSDLSNSEVVGPSYLFSTIDDMVLWLDNFRHRKLGGDSLIERMFQKSKLNDGNENNYGYGLKVEERGGKRIVSHSGQTGSFISMVLYVPEDELGIVILANNRHIRAESLGYKILDLFHPEEKEEAVATSASEPEPFISIDSADMENLEGAYLIDGEMGKIFLTRLGSGLYGIMDGYASDFFRPISDSLFANSLRNALIHIQNQDNREAGRIMLDLRKSKSTLWASRVDPPILTAEQLAADYAGTYYCDPLGIAYYVVVDGERLVILHHRYGDRPLEMTDKDEFVGGIGIVRFSRDEQGVVKSFGITDEDTNFKPLIFMRMK